MHYNFVGNHQSLKITPAMAAGVAVKLWGMSNMVAVLAEWKTAQQFQFWRSELLKGGGGESIIAQRIDSFLVGRQWKEKKFATRIRVDAEEGFSNAQSRLLQGTHRPGNRVKQQRPVL